MPGWFKNAVSRRHSPDDESTGESTKETAEEFRRRLEDHVKARAELLAIEAREAGEVAARKGGLGLLGAFLLIVGYFLVLIASISLFGNWLEHSWPGAFAGIGWQLVAIFTGIFHIALSFILLIRLKRKPAQPLFEYTRAEFQKDREWLQKKQLRKENDDSR